MLQLVTEIEPPPVRMRSASVKKLEAIIRPERLPEVRRALEAVGYPGITLAQVEGHGSERGPLHNWRGESYEIDLLPKVKLEIVANDADVECIIQAIMATAKTGELGDGRIIVLDVREIVRIRTGDRGERAV